MPGVVLAIREAVEHHAFVYGLEKTTTSRGNMMSSSSSSYNIAIVGATGLVGQEFIKVLEQRKFPIKSIRLYASDRSAGKKLFVGHRELVVEETSNDSFKGIDIALFSAGAEISRRFSPIAAKAGTPGYR